MHQERDLLPWILGGLATAAVALAISAVSSQRTVSPTAQPLATVAASGPPVSTAPPLSTAPASLTMPVAPSPAAPAQASQETPQAHAPATGPEAQSEGRPGQIWECTTKGVKTFSNNPCGENSSLVEVGPVNTMNPAMPVHYAHAYPTQPQYVRAYSDSSAQAYEDDSEQDAYEGGADSYSIVQGIAVLPRRRPGHHHPHQLQPHQQPASPYHQPDHHSPAAAPRKF
jgi:hypothetical protein